MADINTAINKVFELLKEREVQPRPEPITFEQLETQVNTLLPQSVSQLQQLVGGDYDEQP